MPDSWKRQPGIGQQPQTLAAVLNRMAKHPRRFNDRARLLVCAAHQRLCGTGGPQLFGVVAHIFCERGSRTAQSQEMSDVTQQGRRPAIPMYLTAAGRAFREGEPVVREFGL
jgi:hypothetical protein